jgi:hypothetical protein
LGVSAYPNRSYNPTAGGSGVVATGGDYVLSLTLITPVTIDDGAVGFSTTGTWTNYSNTSAYQGDYGLSRSSSSLDTATWTFNALQSGQYQVLARWSPSSSRLTNAPYTMYDNWALRSTVNVNQRNAPSGVTADGYTWQNLGTVSITSGTLKVVLTDNASGTVSADAVRIVTTSTIQPVAQLQATEINAQRGSLAAVSQSLFSVSRQSSLLGAAACQAASTPTTIPQISPSTLEVATTFTRTANDRTRKSNLFENGNSVQPIVPWSSNAPASAQVKGASDFSPIDAVFASLGAQNDTASLRVSGL